MDDEIDLIINILKNNDISKNNTIEKTANANQNQIILKKMPNFTNLKYHSRHEIDGGVLNKEINQVIIESIPENDNFKPNNKESKFVKKFFNK